MLTSRLEHSWCPRWFRRWLANKSRSLPSLNKKIGCHLVLKSKAEVIAEVNFKPKAELGKENKTHPPGDISETLPYLCMGWLLYTSSLCDWLWEWRVFNFPIFLVAACKLTCQNNWLNVWIESKISTGPYLKTNMMFPLHCDSLSDPWCFDKQVQDKLARNFDWQLWCCQIATDN